MTETDQQIAIAEACGMKICWPHKDKQVTEQVTIPDSYPYRTVTRHYFVCQKCKRIRGGLVTDTLPDTVPDYLHDLNAMHGVEEAAIEPHLICEYSHHLRRVVEKEWERLGKRVFEFSDLDWQYAVAHATAAQRAEAFLRTKGKYKD